MSGERELLEHAPIAVRCVNADGSLAWANRAELGLFGRDMREHLCYREEELFVEKSVHRELVAELAVGKMIDARHVQLDRRIGGVFDAIVSAIPQLDEQKFLVSWITYTMPRGVDRRAIDRIHRMQAAALAIADSKTEWEAAALAAKLGADGLDAARSGTWLLSRTGDALKLASSIGFPESMVNDFSFLPLDAPINVPLLDAFKKREPVWLGSHREVEERYRALSATLQNLTTDYACACLPLIVDSEIIGVLGFMFTAARVFSDEERTFGLLLSRHCAQALSRARVEQMKVSLRDESERARRRLSLLGDASAAFAEAGLGVIDVAKTVAVRSTELVGDFCSIRLVGDDPRYATMPAFHDRNPEAVAYLRALAAQVKPVADRGSLLYAIEHPSGVLLPTVDPGAFRETVQEEFRPFVDHFPVYSVMLVPLRAHGRVLGAMTMARHDREVPYTDDDLQFVQDIADRAALSILNARQHEELLAERQMLDAVLRQMPSGVMIVDGSTRKVVLSNAQNMRLLGRRDLETGTAPLERSLERGETTHGEELVVSRDGSTDATIRVSSGPVRDKQGRVVAAVATFEDVSAQKLAEERLRFLAEASKMLASSLEHSANIDVVAHALPAHIADRCTVHRLNSEGVLDEGTPKDARDALREGRTVMRETSIAAPIALRDRIFGALTLETRRRRFDRGDLELAEELAVRLALALENADLYQRAQAAIRIRDDFLSIASHELKTPLAALELLVTSLLRSVRIGRIEPEKIAERLKRATEQTSRLASLVNTLLEVSRISAGRVTLNLEDVELTSLAKEVIDRFEHVADRAGTPIHLFATPPVVTQCDRSRIDQVLTNLIGNAIKYGGAQPIDVTIAMRGQQAVLSVRDRGIGIAADDQARIFGRFERAASARHFGGLGLGLWIVSQIAEAHSGSVGVKSAAGEGSTFEVELPLRVSPSL